MSAPKDLKTDKRIGNKFWLQRTTKGPPKKFSDPKVLWGACCEYFQWIEDTPLLEEKVFHTDGRITKTDVSHPRAMTITGLCLFLDLSFETWTRYREQDDLSEITKTADAVIRSQKFEGAAAGLFNPVIIARDLGLKEATTNEHTGPNGGPIKNQFVFMPVGPGDETNKD